MKPQYYRQGDVMIYGPVTRPEGLVKLKSDGRVILAHGEVTGHHHSFAGGTATLLAPDQSAECTHVEIAEAIALLEHQEHDTIAIPKGTYRVIRQREYSPEAIRRVAD
jgi:hypothetical protein